MGVGLIRDYSSGAMAVHCDKEAAIARAHAEDRRQVERLAVRILLEEDRNPLFFL